MKVKFSDERLRSLPLDQLNRLSRKNLLFLLKTKHSFRLCPENYLLQLEEKVFEYPDAEIVDKHIASETNPNYRACGCHMVNSGLTETSEYLTVIPKKYLITR